MDDIKRQDLRVFTQELLQAPRLIFVGLALAFVFGVPMGGDSIVRRFIAMLAVLAVWTFTSYNSSLHRRFLHKGFEARWKGCQDRLNRFDEVLRRLRREQVAELHEVPKTIHAVADTLYRALRRADLIAHEVHLSEKDLYSAPPVWNAPSGDAQSTELYRIADKNIAEYRQHYAGVMAGVQRTEAQSAVFMTTVDTLRMKLLGYRLVGKSPEVNSHDFLEALAEAKLQLQAIDHALEELDLGQYPKTIAAIPQPVPLAGPPPIPDEIQERLRQDT